MHENRETSGASGSNEDRDRLAKAQSHNANMHAPEESDCAVVPMNQPNKEEQSSAEVGEGRARAKENIVQSNTSPTQSGERVSQGLAGVRQAAKERRQERFTALLHHASVGLLRDSFYALKRQAAPGVDGMTWKEYETGLEDRIADLHSRVHRGAYQAQPSRRVYIPKADGRQRPLGIAALEDKIVQQAVVTILNQIYEVDFQSAANSSRRGWRVLAKCSRSSRWYAARKKSAATILAPAGRVFDCAVWLPGVRLLSGTRNGQALEQRDAWQTLLKIGTESRPWCRLRGGAV